ncbi:MAG TPA: hypothetical protein VNT77_09380 [Allosphingosinicella sp.]|nr:hypothetical protein [Allosphingosinicella sp.]
MTQEIQLVVAGGVGGDVSKGNQLREDVIQQFDVAIRELERAIAELVAKQIDPIKVPAEGGDINLRKQLAELIAERDRVVAQINEELAPDTDDEAAEPIAA